MHYLLMLAVVAVVGALLFFRNSQIAAAAFTGNLGTPLLQSVEDLIAQHGGASLDAADLAAVEREAQVLFDADLTSRGLLPGKWKVLLHNDELLGLSCRVTHPDEGEMTLAELAGGVVRREIRLEAV